MIELLASIAIGVVGMALYPFEHEPILKDVEMTRKPGGCWVYYKDGKVCFEPKKEK